MSRRSLATSTVHRLRCICSAAGHRLHLQSTSNSFSVRKHQLVVQAELLNKTRRCNPATGTKHALPSTSNFSLVILKATSLLSAMIVAWQHGVTLPLSDSGGVLHPGSKSRLIPKQGILSEIISALPQARDHRARGRAQRLRAALRVATCFLPSSFSTWTLASPVRTT